VSQEAGEAFELAAIGSISRFGEMALVKTLAADPIDVGRRHAQTTLHYEACKRSLSAGNPVICEETVVNRVERSQRDRALVESAGHILWADIYNCGYPMAGRRARIQRGDLGEIRLMSVGVSSGVSLNDQTSLERRAASEHRQSKADLGGIGRRSTPFQMLEFSLRQALTQLYGTVAAGNRTASDIPTSS